MPYRKIPRGALALLVVCSVAGARGAEPLMPPDASAPAKAMDMDEPMSTGMMKEGMTKGSVRKAEKKMTQKMEPMLDEEQAVMPPSPASPAPDSNPSAPEATPAQ